MLNVAMFGGSRNQRGFFMCLTPVIRNYCFFGFFPLIPLIVATAPLFLPYILLCKTQGRSVNTFDNGNRVMHLPLLLAVPRSIMGCFCKEIEGECPQGKGVEKIT